MAIVARADILAGLRSQITRLESALSRLKSPFSTIFRHRNRLARTQLEPGPAPFLARVLERGRADADAWVHSSDLNSSEGARTRFSTVVEDHVRRLDAAIYGLCPIQDTARAILGIEEIRDNFEHHGS
jgi:hypothetical protein